MKSKSERNLGWKIVTTNVTSTRITDADAVRTTLEVFNGSWPRNLSRDVTQKTSAVIKNNSSLLEWLRAKKRPSDDDFGDTQVKINSDLLGNVERKVLFKNRDKERRRRLSRKWFSFGAVDRRLDLFRQNSGSSLKTSFAFQTNFNYLNGCDGEHF